MKTISNVYKGFPLLPGLPGMYLIINCLDVVIYLGKYQVIPGKVSSQQLT